MKNPTEEDFNELKLEAAIAVEGANWGDAVAYKGFEPCTLKAGEQRVFMGHFYLVADLGYGDGDPVKHGYIAAVATCDGKTSPQIKQEFPYIESDLWAKIVENYINNIRLTDWLNNGVAAHFFKDMASANDVAAVTTMECSDFNLEGPYYNEETRRIEIPYDVFAAEAEKLFVKVPDMTEVNLVNLIYYDDSINAMCRPCLLYTSSQQDLEKTKKIDEGYLKIYQTYIKDTDAEYRKDYNAKGYSYIVTYEDETQIRYLMYDRDNQEGTKAQYVYYKSIKSTDGSWSMMDAEIIDMYQYDYESKEVKDLQQTSW